MGSVAQDDDRGPRSRARWRLGLHSKGKRSRIRRPRSLTAATPSSLSMGGGVAGHWNLNLLGWFRWPESEGWVLRMIRGHLLGLRLHLLARCQH
ncbi:hypothetical protein ACLB2K_013264 [Fragaria x ananassa]